jgi:hypothetical protein
LNFYVGFRRARIYPSPASLVRTNPPPAHSAAKKYRQNLRERSELDIDDPDWRLEWARRDSDRRTRDGGALPAASYPPPPVLPPIRTETKNLLLRLPKRNDFRLPLLIVAVKTMSLSRPDPPWRAPSAPPRPTSQTLSLSHRPSTDGRGRRERTG